MAPELALSPANLHGLSAIYVGIRQKTEPNEMSQERLEMRERCLAIICGRHHLLKAPGSVAFFLADGIFHLTNDR